MVRRSFASLVLTVIAMTQMIPIQASSAVQKEVVVIRGWAGSAQSLNQEQKSELARTIGKLTTPTSQAECVQIIRKGATRAERSLALKRAVAACNYLRQISKGVRVSSSTLVSTRASTTTATQVTLRFTRTTASQPGIEGVMWEKISSSSATLKVTTTGANNLAWLVSSDIDPVPTTEEIFRSNTQSELARVGSRQELRVRLTDLKPYTDYVLWIAVRGNEDGNSTLGQFSFRTRPKSYQEGVVYPPCRGLLTGSGNTREVDLVVASEIDPTTPLRSANAFVRESMGSWSFVRGDMDGRIRFTVKPGSYEISTLPNIRAEYLAERRSYQLKISENFEYEVPGSVFVSGACHVLVGLSTEGRKRMQEVASRAYKSPVSESAERLFGRETRYVLPGSLNRLGSKTEVRTFAWEGEKVTLLTNRLDVDQNSVRKLLSVLDQSWDLLDRMTGFFPKLDESGSPWARTLDGNAVVASIPNLGGLNSAEVISCGGNACAAFSTKGVEMRWEVVESTLWMIENFDLYEFTPIYELGRTFWNHPKCSPVLGSRDGKINSQTGFAVAMMHFVSRQLGISNGPEGMISGDAHYQRILRLESVLASDPTRSLNDLASETLIDGLDSPAIYASLLHRLSGEYGGLAFYEKFYQNCDRFSPARTNLEALTNMKRLSEFAAGTNLDSLFFQRWKLRQNEY